MTMTECEIWNKSKTDNGYGLQVIEGKRYRAHRLAWITANGEIPEGMVVDHKCHNEAAKAGECAGGSTCTHRACVNLDHLQLVSQSENILSGMHSIDVKECCPNGHSYKDERNIMIRKNGKRECAECNRERGRMVWATRLKKQVA